MSGTNGRWIRWATVTLVTVGATLALAHFAFGRRGEWTTRSPEALRAFDRGLASQMRLYDLEAGEEYRRAVALDPTFAAARVQLARYTRDPEERKAQIEALAATDLATLTPRERFLVESILAAKEPARQQKVVEEALAEQPHDPWVLSFAAGKAWDSEDWAKAEEYYRQLLDVDPNWVVAHNHLGYLAMSQSRFDRSEEHFRTYAYVAPDQANPHDSLGELLTLRGRYDEAAAEFEQALAERPDFCASYMHLAAIAVNEGDLARVPATLDRARANCPEKVTEELECETRFDAAFIEHDADRPWREGWVACAGEPGSRGVLFHRLAILSGRRAEALAEEGAMRELLGGDFARMRGKKRSVLAELHHEAGVRELVDGHPAEAAAEFRAADENAIYWGAMEGRFKLFNRMHLALALDRANDAAGSERMIGEVRAVNPAFAALYPRLLDDLDGRR